jgi:hypothetical protein
MVLNFLSVFGIIWAKRIVPKTLDKGIIACGGLSGRFLCKTHYG